MPNNAPDTIFFIGAGFSKMQAALPLKEFGHWLLRKYEMTVQNIGGKNDKE